MEIGPVEANGMGRSPIGWQAIDAWARQTLAQPTPWEARLLRRLSADYLAESHRAEDCHHPAPWWPESLEVDQEANERQLRAVLG
jgi:hypothetical protein